MARRRAARLQGWSPLLAGEQLAATTRTRPLDSIAELARLIVEVQDMAAQEQGPGTCFQVQVHTPGVRYPAEGGSVEEDRDHLGTLEEIGVDHFVLQPPSGSVDAVIDSLQGYAATFALG